MRGKAAGEATSSYSLGFNVVEGSVQVLLDGGTLVQNVDYTVDYIIGEVVIKNERALVPGANLQIKYEQNDLFQLASKTLLGARGDSGPLQDHQPRVHGDEPQPADPERQGPARRGTEQQHDLRGGRLHESRPAVPHAGARRASR